MTPSPPPGPDATAPPSPPPGSDRPARQDGAPDSGRRGEARPAPRRVAAWVALPVAVAAVLLTVLIVTRDPAAERRAASPLVGGLAPSIVGTATDGQPFDLDDLRGRWVVVNFFSTFCVPCIAEHPELVAFSRSHAAAGDAALVSVVFDDTAANVEAFFEENGGDWPVIADDSGRVAVAYGVTGVPESYMVAPSGLVVWKYLGGVTAAGLDSVIAQLTRS